MENTNRYVIMKTLLTPLVFLVFVIPLTTPLMSAQPTNAELLSELQQLRERVSELESLIIHRTETAPIPQEAVPQKSREPVQPGSSGKTQEREVLIPGNVNSKFGMELYGYIKLDAMAHGQDVFVDAVPFWVRQSNGSNDDGQFNMTAKETRLGAKLRGPDFGEGKVTGLAEFDFYGDFSATSGRHAYQMRSRQLYLQYSQDDWSLLAGKTWETYLTTFPQTLNFTYYNLLGQLGLRKNQIRLTKNIKIDEASSFIVKAALAESVGGLHGGDLDGDGIDDGAESNRPSFEYALTYVTPVLNDEPAKFSFSGFVGQETADTNGDGSDQDFDTYAVIGGLEFPLTDQFTLKGSIWTGTNLDGAWGGIGQGINTTTHDTIDACGGWAQLGFQATDKLKLNLGYSIDNPKDDDLPAGGRSENSSYLINALYSFTPSFILGFEYMHLETGYKGAADEETDFIQSSLIFKF